MARKTMLAGRRKAGHRLTPACGVVSFASLTRDMCHRLEEYAMADDDLTATAVPAGARTPRGTMIGPPPTTEVRFVLPFGIPAFVFALASIVTCYAGIATAFLLGVDYVDMNVHVQAVLMWAFAVLAVGALWWDRRIHHNNLPLALAAVAAAILITTLYVRYAVEFEIIAYTLLVIAAVLNQNVFLAFLNRRVRDQADEIDALNRDLERKVEHQDHEIGRLARLKQFLPPQVAELVVSEGNENLLDTHRRYVACVFCDIRNFTSVSEDVEPEEVIAILQAYHERIGHLVTEHRGTIGYRAGDGLMVFFNDPIPCEQPVLDAVKLAIDIRAAFDEIRAPWLKLGLPIGLGLGVASGYATLGLVGLQGRTDYTAIGGAVNIAARLCDQAADGQILLSQRAHADVETVVRVERLGTFKLKGVRNEVEAYGVLGLKDDAP
jgi:class 3 adenylate cyclase